MSLAWLSLEVCCSDCSATDAARLMFACFHKNVQIAEAMAGRVCVARVAETARKSTLTANNIL